MRLTEKANNKNCSYDIKKGCLCNSFNKLGQLEDIEEQLGIDLITFLKGIDPDTCFMEITKDKEFYLCGDAYCGNFSKQELLKFIQELLFMYRALTKEELE